MCGSQVQTVAYGSVTFVMNNNPFHNQSATAELGGKTLFLPGQCLLAIKADAAHSLLFNSSAPAAVAEAPYVAAVSVRVHVARSTERMSERSRGLLHAVHHPRIPPCLKGVE